MTDRKFGYGEPGAYRIVDAKEFEHDQMGKYGWVIIDKVVTRVPVEEPVGGWNDKSRKFVKDESFASPGIDQYGNPTNDPPLSSQTVYEDKVMLVVMHDEDSMLGQLNKDLDVANHQKNAAESKLKESESKQKEAEDKVEKGIRTQEQLRKMLDEQRDETRTERKAKRKMEEALGAADAELSKIREALGSQRMRDILEGA